MLSDSAILLVYRGSVILSQTAVDALSTRQFTQSTLGCRGNQRVPAISPNGFSPSAVRPRISAASFAASTTDTLALAGGGLASTRQGSPCAEVFLPWQRQNTATPTTWLFLS